MSSVQLEQCKKEWRMFTERLAMWIECFVCKVNWKEEALFCHTVMKYLLPELQHIQCYTGCKLVLILTRRAIEAICSTLSQKDMISVWTISFMMQALASASMIKLKRLIGSLNMFVAGVEWGSVLYFHEPLIIRKDPISGSCSRSCVKRVKVLRNQTWKINESMIANTIKS